MGKLSPGVKVPGSVPGLCLGTLQELGTAELSTIPALSAPSIPKTPHEPQVLPSRPAMHLWVLWEEAGAQFLPQALSCSGDTPAFPLLCLGSVIEERGLTAPALGMIWGTSQSPGIRGVYVQSHD